jgi:hypothetical protein
MLNSFDKAGVKKKIVSPQILVQLVEMLKLLELDIMIGVRISISPLCAYEFSIACYFIYLKIYFGFGSRERTMCLR